MISTYAERLAREMYLSRHILSETIKPRFRAQFVKMKETVFFWFVFLRPVSRDVYIRAE